MNATVDGTPKCAHSPCVCAPTPGSAYCSQSCAHAATSGPPRIEPVCECGHAACQESGNAG
jgi:hypothetical protein